MPPAHPLTPSPTILVPHLPPKTLVGIDLITFTSTPNFHGVRDLPTGWHFLYTGTTQSLSLRSGGWFYIGDISALDANNNTNSGGGDTQVTLVRQLPHAQSQAHAEVIVWKWDTDNEMLVPLRESSDLDRQEAMRYKANLGAVWSVGGLFRYRSRVPPSVLAQREGVSTAASGEAPSGEEGEGQQTQAPSNQGQRREEIAARQSAAVAAADEENEADGRRDWQGLTDALSPALMTRIIGDPEMDVDGRPRWMVTSAGSALRDSDDIPGLEEIPAHGTAGKKQDEESEFGFLPIDLKRTWREGAIGRERTEAAQDRSWALGEVMRRVEETYSGSVSVSGPAAERQVLGELQFTFLMGLTLINYSCLQQWKRLLELVLTCRGAIVDREMFMRDVLRLLLLQLKRCDDVEGGLFDLDGEEGGVFLRKLLVKFRRALYAVGDGVGTAVKREFAVLETWVRDEYDWELNREAVVRRGMVQLEDGEEVELEMNDDDEDDEMGEYAPMVVDLGGSTENVDVDTPIGEDSDVDDPRM